ncbi:hypothetical protein E2562_012857 [Oryza meyeriana var. granulata]|uniref:Uncharacterized protein n=1 Tax=Oryza meyeriana var. granulata TaxID=110450 RepID=A0A6G1CPS6_9ORYZ|nr:hypothetical protein E2562_012857 [Oryza meyeriana var. granulata]
MATHHHRTIPATELMASRLQPPSLRRMVAAAATREDISAVPPNRLRFARRPAEVIVGEGSDPWWWGRGGRGRPWWNREVKRWEVVVVTVAGREGEVMEMGKGKGRLGFYICF